MKLVYLASPYTHRDQFIMELRASLVGCLTAQFQLEFGTTRTFFSPIVHGHNMTKTKEGQKLPHTWDYWKPHDLNILKRCDELWVVCMEGWEDSTGVQEEIQFAKDNNMSIQKVCKDGRFLD